MANVQITGLPATLALSGNETVEIVQGGVSMSATTKQMAALAVPGPIGPTGLKGDKGDKGDTGNTGPQGNQGIQGVPGAAGNAGGTDGQIQYNNAGQFNGMVVSGDGSLTRASLGAFTLTITKTNNVPFGPYATATSLPLFTSSAAGAVPASGGGATKFLCANATWVVPVPGAAGSNGDIQINNGGALGAVTPNGAGAPLGTTGAVNAVFTGAITISGLPSAGSALFLNKAQGNGNSIVGQVAGSYRWLALLGDSATETGGGAGSNFSLNTYGDGGAYIGTPFAVNRVSGYVTINGNGAASPGVPTGAFGHASLNINKNGSGKVANIIGLNNGSPRWEIDLGSTGTENGSNAGSDFYVHRFNDAGAYLDSPFSINRASGAVTYSQPVNSPLGFTVGLGTAVHGDSIEVGRPGQNAGAYLDFHSSVNNNDYDARIIATGGAAAVGGATLAVVAAAFNVSGNGYFGGILSSGPMYMNGAAFNWYTGVQANYFSLSDSAGNGGQYRDINFRGVDSANTVAVNMNAFNVYANSANFSNTITAGGTISGGNLTTPNTVQGGYVTSTGTVNGLTVQGTYLYSSGNVAGAGTIDGAQGTVGRQGAGGAAGQAICLFWDGAHLANYVGGTFVGYTQYISDYRFKRNVAPLLSVWDRVKALNPVKYNLKDFSPEGFKSTLEGDDGPLVVGDTKERWGFLAHELQAVLIEDAASGLKDIPNHIQTPNPWTVIAALTKTLQEAMARIEEQDARIRILEARA